MLWLPHGLSPAPLEVQWGGAPRPVPSMATPAGSSTRNPADSVQGWVHRWVDGGVDSGQLGRFLNRPVGALESLLVPRRRLVASSAGTAPEFGSAVALDPGDSRRAALAYVGAPRAHVDGGGRGVVQIFRSPSGGVGHWLDGWGHLVQGRGLAVGARFGASLAASGGLFVVGAPGANSPGGERSGLVRIYSAPGTGPGAIHRPRLLAELHPPAGLDGAAFGATLAIETAADGEVQRLAVGAPKAMPAGVALAGRVFVYRRSPGGGFVLDFEAMASEPRVAATFGASLAFAGTYLIVGAPGDGQLAPGAGRVYGFGPDGALAFELAPPIGGRPGDGPIGGLGAAGARFGSALGAVGARGFAVSSFGRGLVEIFRVVHLPSSGKEPIHEQTLRGLPAHRFGTSLATSGQLLMVGAPGAPSTGVPSTGVPGGSPPPGQVYVYARLAGVWRPAGALRSVMPAPNGEFGLTLASAGGHCVVGEPGSNGACPQAAACLAGMGAVFRMPR